MSHSPPLIVGRTYSNRGSIQRHLYSKDREPGHRQFKYYWHRPDIKYTIHITLQEHLRDIRNEKPTSGPYMHIKDNPSHYFDANDARIIDRERNDSLRRFKESIYISKSSAYNCNLERGIFVNPTWSATLNIFFKSP